MKIRTAATRSIVLAALSSFALPAFAVLATPAYAYSEQERYFNREQIEQLTAPIALYPDPLLAQILTAAPYPEEIAAAQRYARGRSDWNDIDRQDWDYSVRAVARYPEILDFLARDLEWTEALGIANINQPDDVADAIQRWRLQAYNLGNLRDGPQQIVYVENGYVRIVPAEQDYFYVPRYEPEVVYVTRYIGTPFIIFGPAYAYGAWFDRDWDWRRRRICYTDRRHWHNGRPIFHPRFDHVHVDRDWKPDRRRFKPPQTPHMPPRFVNARVPSPPPHIKPGMRPDERPRDGRDQPRPGVYRPGDKPDGDRDNRRDDNRRDENKRDGDGRDDDRRQQVRPQDRPDNPNDPRQYPTVRRGNDRDFKREDRPGLGGAAPQPGNEQPTRVETPRPEPQRRLEQPARVEPTRRIEQQPEPRREQPRQEQRRVEQPQPQPQPQAQPQQQQQQQQRQAPSRRQDEEQFPRGPRR